MSNVILDGKLLTACCHQCFYPFGYKGICKPGDILKKIMTGHLIEK